MRDGETTAVQAQMVWLPRRRNGLWVLHVTGPTEPRGWAALTGDAPAECVGVVLELSGARWAETGLPDRRLGAAAGPDRRVYVTGVPPRAARTLRGEAGPGSVLTAPTLAEVIARFAGAAPATTPAPPVAAVAPPPYELRDLRRQLHSRVVIAQAQGILQGRYAIGDGQLALRLLKEVAQSRNLRLRHLAASLVAARVPVASAESWFPGRARRLPPRATFLSARRAATANRSEALSALLDRALATAGAGMGVIRLADPLSGTTRPEAHRSPDDSFLSAWELADDTAPAHCVHGRAVPVTALDVTGDPLHAPAVRAALLASGARTRHSVPLTAPDGRILGELSVHHGAPGVILGSGALRELVDLGREAGAWLEWHHRTVVLDALEELHTRARDLGPDETGAGPGETRAGR
ncbi:ANTAR domain-containing protein [Streptomyces sp. NPDC020875]|uniref:ANTAR domain-containing protein n=1 Tax=Streptomyces sp. NPDC020875 TaxID=3154898 RepID=UPI0034042034